MSLEDHIRRLSETIVGELRAPIEASLHRLLEEVLASAGREREEALARATAAETGRQQAADQLALLGADAERKDAQLASLLAEAERKDAQLASLLADAEQKDAELATLRADAEQREQSVGAAAASQAEAQEALDLFRDAAEAEKELALAALQADLARAHEAELTQVRATSTAEVAAAIEQARAEIAEQRDAGSAVWQADREELLRRHESQLARLDEEHRAALEAVRAALAAEHAEATARLQVRDEEARAAGRQTLAGERQADLACSERLLDAFRQIDSAPSLSEVLAALSDRVTGEAGRCALLLVEGSRLRGWRLGGFPGLQPSDLDLPLDEAGALADAVAGRAPVATTSDAADSLPALLLAPGARAGLALPLLVGQRSVAVLYADDAGAERPVAPSDWPEITEVLVRHAARCLEVMTIARVSGPIGQRVLPPIAAPAPVPAMIHEAVATTSQDGPESDAARHAESAQRYARLLLSEVKLYNESAVEEGRRECNLLARLGPEIERARRLYEEKIPAVVRERADWFDLELVRTLAGGNAALLGQVT